MKWICLVCLTLCILLFGKLQGQPCISLTDTIGRVYPSDTLPDMTIGVAYSAQVRAILYSTLWVPPLTVVFDSFGLDPNLVFPSGLQLDCPLNSSYCMAYPMSNYLRLCYRLYGTPAAQNPAYPGYDSILITGTYRTDIPLLVPIWDTIVLYYRIAEGVHAADPSLNDGARMQLGVRPSSNTLWISCFLPQRATVELEVVDLVGKVHAHQKFENCMTGANELEMHLSDIPTGIYVLRVASIPGEVRAARKFAWIR